jgi:hypothetical protein
LILCPGRALGPSRLLERLDQIKISGNSQTTEQRALVLCHP